MRNKVTMLSLTGLLSLSSASAKDLSFQSTVGDQAPAIHAEGNIYVTYSEEDCEEKKKCGKVPDNKLRQCNEQLPKAQLTKVQRLLKQGNQGAAKKILDRNIKNNIPALAEMLWESGNIDESKLDYEKAIISYRRAVVLDENNPKYLLSAGKTAHATGIYEEAQKWLERLLKIRKRKNVNNQDVADAQRDLACLYDDIGKNEDAEKLYLSALKIYETEFGMSDPFVANVLHDLADYYRRRGDYGKAEPMFDRCLNIIEKILDQNDPKIAVVAANFALLYKEIGKNDKADFLFSRSL